MTSAIFRAARGGEIGMPGDDPVLGRCRTRGLRGLGSLILMVFLYLGNIAAAAAQQTPGPIDGLVEQARESGARVIIIEPPGGAAEPGNATSPLGAGARAVEIAGQAIVRLGEVFGNLREQLTSAGVALAELSPDGSALWPAQVALVTVLGLILGHVAFRVLCGMLAVRPPVVEGVSAFRSARLGMTVGRAFLGAVGVGIEILFGLLLSVIMFGDATPVRMVVSVVLENALLIRVAMVFFLVALCPGDGATRPVTMSDGAARRLWAHLRLGLLGIFVLVTLALLILEANAGPDLSAFAVILGTGVAALVVSSVVLLNRRSLEELAAGGGASLLMRRLWILAIGYAGLAWLVSSVRALLGLPHALGLVGAPIVAAMIAISLYVLLVIAIGRLYGRAWGVRTVEGADEAPGNETERRWTDRPALVVALGVAALYLLHVWGIELRQADGRVGLVVTGLLTLCLGYAAWAAIRAWFDRKIAEEVGAGDPTEADEGGGAGATRLATLLPLFRNVILATIVTIGVMLLLLEAGVNIAPLFAGAGILGLAIGFGAQTLIRDIFSGLFFLIDDAFRVGEYIETGAAKGRVERISIRSMQLRHHNGPLHTIPFGEIQQLTNYSRDWVIMKLPLRVTLDTDPERVRKLVKKLGQDLLADPQVGEKFLQPLKSQGVLSIDNYGMVIRVKFMTKPGDQFITRRVVYHRIHELFEREGIEFASRDVRVRVDPADARDPRVAQAAAVVEAEAVDEQGAAGPLVSGGPVTDQR